MARANGKTVAVIAGGAGLLLLLMGSRKATASTAPGLAGTPQGPPPPPPTPDPGMGPGGFQEPTGEPPPEPPLGGFDLEGTPGVGPVNPADIVGPWISDVPMGRRFYTVNQGNTLRGVARKALGVNLGHPDIQQAMQCIASSVWNLTMYGTPCVETLEPCFDAVPVEGQEYPMWDIRQAFLPSHVNAVASMFDGVMPERTIGYEPQSEGVYTGNYGTLWIPDMTYNEQTGEVICTADIPTPVATLLGFEF